MTAIGIDLGTTNTVVAVVRDGRAITLEDDKGGRLIPSVIAFTPQGDVHVGQAAKERRFNDPTNTVYSVKRLIGRPWSSPEVQQAVPRFPFELREGPKDTTMVALRGKQYALPEVSAFVLRRAKAIAEKRLGTKVDKAVITVPANFNDLQRAATKVAGKLAGLEVLRILNEPTAAALAYGQSITQSERIAVFDLGGGTFDITLLDLSGQVFEVLATAGDTSLGGDDLDVLIAERMSAQFREIHRFDPMSVPEAFGKLRLVAEKLKIRLSQEQEIAVNLTDIAFGEGGASLNLRFRMNRKELEHLAHPLVDRTLKVTRCAIEAIHLGREAFDRVILVGGSTRMPLVARRVEEYFGKPPHLRVNPDEVVALGAAIQAFALDKETRKKPSAARSPGAYASTSEEKTVPTLVSPAAAPPRVAQSLPASRPRQAPNLPATAVVTAHGIAPPPPMRPRLNTFDATLQAMPRGPAAGRAPEPRPDVEPPATTTTVDDPARDAPASTTRIDATLPDTTGAREDASPLRDLPRNERDITFTLPLPAAPAPPSPPLPPLPPETPAVAAPSIASSTTSIVAEHAAEWRPPSIPVPSPAAPVSAASIARDAPTQDLLVREPGADDHGIVARDAAMLLIDVTPLSLCVETVGGWCDVLIPANSPVPCDRSRVFLTAADGQTVVCVNVAQGDSRRFAENTFLGQLELPGLDPKPRGEVRIEVTFEIDADGILNVRAKDIAQAREVRARMRLLGGSTAQDVEAMLARQAQHEVH